MFFTLPAGADRLRTELQHLLDTHNPLPDAQIARLCNLAAATGDTERDAAFRRLVVDVDSLLMDLRWSIGHALLILRAFPELDTPASDADAPFDRIGVPNRARVLLRPFMAGQNRVFYSDLLEQRPGGGRVGGWMLHILVDDAVSRAIGVLDRLAHLILRAADVPAPRNRMYFRTRKLELLRDTNRVPVPQALIDLASGEEFSLLLDYRDGLAHTVRPMTRLMGAPPVDDYVLPTGERVNERPVAWTAAYLVGLALLGFDLCVQAMPHVSQACEHYITPRRDT